MVDSSACIEWLIDSPAGRIVTADLPPRDRWLIPTMVQLELSQWSGREIGEDEADQVIAFTETCNIVELTQCEQS